MISRFERFSSDIFQIYRYWHKIASDEMEKYGLKGPHAVYLVAMRRYDDGITAAKLGELCSKDKSDVSRAISLMEKKGLVTRECVNQNLYRALLKLTDNGKNAAEHIGERARCADKEANPLYPVPKLMDAAELEYIYYQAANRNGEK